MPSLLILSESEDLRKNKQKARRDRCIARRMNFVLLVIVLVTAWVGLRSYPSIHADVYTSTRGGFQRHREPGITGKPVLQWRRTLMSSATRDASSAHDAANKATARVDSSRSLSFQVCNGFTNQRLSIVYAAILAKETGRGLILPDLLLDGTQEDTSKESNSSNTMATHFGTFYDVEVFVSGMEEAGVRVLGGGAGLFQQSEAVLVPARDLQTLLDVDPASGSNLYRDAKHLSIDCPLLKLDKSVVGRHRELVERVLSSLVPAEAQKTKIDKLKSELGASGHYNVLHLRVERDWIKHCQTWKSNRGICLAEEVVRSIGEHLDLKGVPRSMPLYVTCDVPAADTDLLNAAMNNLKTMGYKKITLQGYRKDKGKKIERLKERFQSNLLDREIRAMHSYYLAMDSSKYIGNSVSTFSALLLLERQTRNRWSTYYNMGGIPLMDFVPFFRMPWVFTYNGESPGFDYMAKSAVLSAIRVGQVIPYCLYMGDKGDEMYQWLKKQGVTVVLHDPSWKVNVAQKYDEAKKFAKIAATYESIMSLVATFMRFDIPIVHALYQYNYVLYTDIDVLFLKKIDLHSFPPKLPEALVMANEVGYEFPCNAGVILYNLPYMRQSYHDLVTIAMQAPGLHFGDKYGPADQGALNQFYEFELDSRCSLPEAFNAKPYKLGDFSTMDDVYILHFHGPKPKHYVDFANGRGCGPFSSAVGGGHFLKLCRDGLKNLCDLQLHLPESTRSGHSWGLLSQLQSRMCKSNISL